MGIYGDYLFSQVSRFGSGPLETAVGPSVGTASDFVKLVLKARDAGLSADEKVKAADWLNFATQNTPMVNLFYTKPVLDYLFLNSMKEAVSPGYTAKTRRSALEGLRAAQHASEALAALQLRSKPIVPPTTTTPTISCSQRFVSRSAALLPAAI
jgi:hypothetical protein